jgi:hypothetical protein
LPDGGYERNVFVNCPFDDDYQPILQAILFCLIDCGMSPRLSTERLDAENRLDKIVDLIAQSQFSIHDLSRVKASRSGEFARLNMPFELGVDYGFRRASARFATKRALVIATSQYEHQIALSDLAGFDIASHDDNFERAIKHVRACCARTASRCDRQRRSSATTPPSRNGTGSGSSMLGGTRVTSR